MGLVLNRGDRVVIRFSQGTSMWRRILQILIFILPVIVHADIAFLMHESTGNPWYLTKKVDTGFGDKAVMAPF